MEKASTFHFTCLIKAQFLFNTLSEMLSLSLSHFAHKKLVGVDKLWRVFHACPCFVPSYFLPKIAPMILRMWAVWFIEPVTKLPFLPQSTSLSLPLPVLSVAARCRGAVSEVVESRGSVLTTSAFLPFAALEFVEDIAEVGEKSDGRPEEDTIRLDIYRG